MNTYLLFKSLHLIAVISWMAGLLYLPRIFVYHTENIHQKETSKIFKVMERRLFNYIMMPAMILTWIFGILLIGNLGVHVLYELLFWGIKARVESGVLPPGETHPQQVYFFEEIQAEGDDGAPRRISQAVQTQISIAPRD